MTPGFAGPSPLASPGQALRSLARTLTREVGAGGAVLRAGRLVHKQAL